MKFGIITSTADNAGVNIKKHLTQLKEDEPLRVNNNSVFLHTIESDTIYYDQADSLNCDILIFATKHKSSSGNKTLSVHFPGNYHDAKYGGTKKQLCVAPTTLQKLAYQNLEYFGRDSGYDITLEATHHGPTLTKPVMFIEIGSTLTEWQDLDAGVIIAKTIMKTIHDYEQKDYICALGFGGLHYCNNFNKIELTSNYALSHICPKYAIKYLDEELINELIAKSVEKVQTAILDWKGLDSKQKEKLIPLLEVSNLVWIKSRQIKY